MNPGAVSAPGKIGTTGVGVTHDEPRSSAMPSVVAHLAATEISLGVMGRRLTVPCGDTDLSVIVRWRRGGAEEEERLS